MSTALTAQQQKIFDFMVAFYIANDESGPVIESRYGLKKGYASRIRAGRCWADTASPFAGLRARV